MKRLIPWCVLLSFAAISTVQADTHPAVQAALDWQLPSNECEPPDPKYGQTIVDSDGIPSTSQKLSPSKARLEAKKKKRFDKCIETYKKGLVSEFGKLREVAKHGLTQEQADMILGKLARIQAVVQDPMANPPE